VARSQSPQLSSRRTRSQLTRHPSKTTIHIRAATSNLQIIIRTTTIKEVLMTITITHRRIKIMTRVTSSRATSNPRLRPFQLMKNLTCHLSCLEGPKRRPSLLLRIRMIARVITIMDRPTLRTTLMLIMEAINSLRASLTTMVMAMEAAKLTPSTIKTQAKIKTTARISSRILISTSRTTCRHLLTTNRKLTIMLQ